MDEMKRMVSRELVKFAVQHKIFCPRCKNVMGMRRAVLVDDGKQSSSVCCAPCWDIMSPIVEAKAKEFGMTLEVTDGRELWGRQKRTVSRAQA